MQTKKSPLFSSLGSQRQVQVIETHVINATIVINSAIAVNVECSEGLWIANVIFSGLVEKLQRRSQ